MGVRRGLTVLVVGVVVVAASGFATAPGGVGGPTMAVTDGDRPTEGDFRVGTGVSAEDRLDGPSDTIRAKLQPASDAAATRIQHNVTARHEFGDVVTATVTGAEYNAFADDPDVRIAPVQRVRLAQWGDGDESDPDVSWIEPTDGARLNGTVPIEIDAQGSFGQIEDVTWRVDGGSTRSADQAFWSSRWHADWDTTQLADGTHVLTAIVETRNGVNETATVEVSVNNGKRPPQVTWASPTDGATATGEVPLRIDASDPDGTVEGVTWRVGEDGPRRDATAAGDGTWTATWNAANHSAGTHALTATAIDSAGADASDTVSVSVPSNETGDRPAPNETDDGPLAVSWHSPGHDERVDGQVPLSISAVDDNGSVERVRWRHVEGESQGRANYDADSERYTATWDASDVETGTHQLTAVAIDDTDNLSTATISVTVGEEPATNGSSAQPPSVNWTAPTTGEQVRGPTPIGIEATDPNGTVETLRWRVDDGPPREATADGNGTWEATWNASTVDPGGHNLTAVAVDDDENRSNASIGVEVVAGERPPTIDVVAPADNQTVNGTIPVRVSASDPDGSVRAVRWQIDGGQPHRATGGNGSWTAEWNTSTVAPGEHTLTAAAIDNDDLIVNETVDVTVGGANRAPNVSWHSPHEGEELEGFVEIEVEADDPDGSVKRAAWRIEGRTPQQLTYDEDTGYWVDSIDVDDLEGGTYTLETRVADGTNETASATIDVEVDASNQAPTVEWDDPGDDDELSGEVDLRIEASDPDGNLESVRWAVEQRETPHEPTETDSGGVWQDTFDTTSLDDGTYTLRAGARDAEGADAYDKVTVRVKNDGQTGAPSVSWAWPRDNETLATHEVPVQIEADAGGGEVETLRWQVDGGNPRTASYDNESGYYESTWDAGAVASGDHELRTRFKTAEGKTASATVSVTVSGSASTATPGSSQRPNSSMPYGVQAVYGGTDEPPGGGNGVDVAVLDSGIDVDHPDLRGSFARCLDVADTGTCQDKLGHGTHVSGLVAADGVGGMYGVAPSANLHAYKVVDDEGVGYADDVAASIRNAAENDVEIAVLSGRTEASGSLLEHAIDRHSDDLLVVAAAGNGGPEAGSIAPPAAAPSAVAVGALDRTGRVVEGSARGANAEEFCACQDHLELVAAGQSVQSTWHDGGYQTRSGTSVAAPHVAGVAATAWASGAADLDEDGTVTPTEVRKYLRQSARDVTNGAGTSEGYDPASGVGMPTVP